MNPLWRYFLLLLIIFSGIFLSQSNSVSVVLGVIMAISGYLMGYIRGEKDGK